MKPQVKRQKRIIRHRRVRAKIFGTEDRPRLSVFRGHKNMFLQLIDDATGKTLVWASTKEVKGGKGKQAQALAAAKILSEKARGAGIKRIVFDRGGFRYHGRVRAVAETVRKAGLNF